MYNKAKKRQLTELRRGPDGIIGPPAWYRQRMAELRKLPPPTLEQVIRQMHGSIEQRSIRYGKFRWKDSQLSDQQKRTHVIR